MLLICSGESENWYEHDPHNPSEPQPKPRIHGEEAQIIHDKVAGTLAPRPSAPLVAGKPVAAFCPMTLYSFPY